MALAWWYRLSSQPSPQGRTDPGGWLSHRGRMPLVVCGQDVLC